MVLLVHKPAPNIVQRHILVGFSFADYNNWHMLSSSKVIALAMMRVIFSPRRATASVSPDYYRPLDIPGTAELPQDTYFELDGPSPGRQRSELQAGKRVSYLGIVARATFQRIRRFRE